MSSRGSDFSSACARPFWAGAMRGTSAPLGACSRARFDFSLALFPARWAARQLAALAARSGSTRAIIGSPSSSSAASPSRTLARDTVVGSSEPGSRLSEVARLNSKARRSTDSCRGVRSTRTPFAVMRRRFSGACSSDCALTRKKAIALPICVRVPTLPPIFKAPPPTASWVPALKVELELAVPRLKLCKNLVVLRPERGPWVSWDGPVMDTALAPGLWVGCSLRILFNRA
mmetsp:Transcript_5877/g.13592  ORF Transcript_5877/g.13592 Transcript_5877/m.13592 type:complete len:231 (-) Transcript_5877:97-789(-)